MNDSAILSMPISKILAFVDEHTDVCGVPGCETPRASVCILTYSHANFIARCLDSILMQQTDFPIEILLGEDYSTDGTREICIEYARKHPDKIRLFLSKENLGKYTGGNGRLRFLYNLNKSRGKYIALCEGDDYWTDPLKLQKQVYYLERHPDCVICAHGVRIEMSDGSIADDFLTHSKRMMLDGSGVHSVDDLLKVGNFIHTPSVVFRNVITAFPPELFQSPVGDYFLYVLLAQNGNVHLMDDVMAVYRYGVGVHSRLSSIDSARKTLEYHLCILSYLHVEQQRLLFLGKTRQCVSAFAKALQDACADNVFLSSRKSIKDLFCIIGLKVYHKLCRSLRFVLGRK